MIPSIPIEALVDVGLTLQAAIAVDDLDGATRRALADAEISITSYRTLLLFAQAGRTFWERSVVDHLDLPEPFDDRAREVVADWFEKEHSAAGWTIVYPGPAHIPLGQLAQRAGWGASSPLGLTIHPEFGLWLAHRIVVLTDLEFSPRADTSEQPDHPCASCTDTPCVTACPVGAVTIAHGYDVEACATHRISEGSDCAEQCLARNACPVGAEHQYGADQMRHHYGAGLRSIRDWLRPGGDGSAR